MLAQRDPKWANVKLGFGTGTLGQYGCIVTSFTDGMNSRGWDETPITVNDKMKAVNGFTGTTKNLWIWAAPEKAWPGIVKLVKIDYYDSISANLAQLDSYIKQNFVVLLEVSAAGIGGTGSHFIRAKEVINNDVIIRDPWYAEEAPITKHYKIGNVDTPEEIILKFIVYDISVNPNNMSTTDPLQVCLQQHDMLVDKLNKLEPQLEEKTKLITELTGQLESEKATSESRKKKYDGFIEYLANKLGCAGDEDVIKGSIEELLLVEDKLLKAENEMKEMKILHEQEKLGFQDEITKLKEEVRIAKENYDTISDKLEELSKEIAHAKEVEEKVNKFLSIISSIKTWFVSVFAQKEDVKPVTNAKEIETKTNEPTSN